MVRECRKNLKGGERKGGGGGGGGGRGTHEDRHGTDERKRAKEKGCMESKEKGQ